MPEGNGGAVEFLAELARLRERLDRLPARRWSGVRQAVAEVVQHWADADADLEGEPRRALPRLARDAALVDQLAVVGSDLALAAAQDEPGGAPVLRAARADIARLLDHLGSPS